jgi:Flp pilus assembly protein TadG
MAGPRFRVQRTSRGSGKHRSRGQSMVEFALVAPLFFALIFGTIELGRLMWVDHSLANATREGARYAMVHGSKSTTPATDTEVQAVVEDKAPGVTSALSVSTTGLGGEPGTSLSVNTSYDFSFITADIFGLSSVNLNHTSTVIIQH